LRQHINTIEDCATQWQAVADYLDALGNRWTGCPPPPTRMRNQKNKREWQHEQEDIEECVRESLHSYFRDLGGETPDGMYDMLVRLVEKPLLEVVMSQADNNQSRAAEWLGLNRNTLRKKLVEHKLL
jgi:Fis family transcriptional regulator